MTSYWNKEYIDRGIDGDLGACLEYNPQDFSLDDIDKVLAVWTGENDGDNWRWVLRMKDETHRFLRGGCDYTGWDCQSSAWNIVVPAPVNDWGFEDNPSVVASLSKQLEDGKNLTWREQTQDDMPDVPHI